MRENTSESSSSGSSGIPAWMRDRSPPPDASLVAIADAALKFSDAIERAFSGGCLRAADRLIEMIVEWGASVERDHGGVTIYFGDPSEAIEALSIIEQAVRELREKRRDAD